MVSRKVKIDTTKTGDLSSVSCLKIATCPVTDECLFLQMYTEIHVQRHILK